MLAVLQRGGGHALAGGDDIGMRGLAHQADAVAVIACAKEERIITGDGGDFIHLLQGFGRFDLENNQLFGIAVVHIVSQWHLAEKAVHVAAVQGLAAQRTAAHHVHHIAGFLSTGDVRHHDGSGIAFEGFYILAVAAFVHAHDGVHVMELGGADLMLQVQPVIGHVLVAQPHGGGPGEAGELDDARINQVEFEDGGILTGTEFAKDSGRAEFHVGLKKEGAGEQ